MGFVDSNLQVLMKLGAIFAALGLPFVAIGDYNDTPSALASTGWLEAVNGVVVPPVNTDGTCRAGEHRLLEFAVVHESLRPVYVFREGTGVYLGPRIAP